ncbi:MAG: hypothetical protein ACE5E5_00590 [Phycisphaerae bacterium]
MKITILVRWSCLAAMVVGMGSGCQEEQQPPKPAKPASPAASHAAATSAKAVAATKAPASAPPSAPAAAAGAKGNVLTHGGISFTVPAGWVPQVVEPGPLAAKASYKLTGDGAGCTVRVTHYPNMRGREGMDDFNIKRWVSQVKKPDGSPMTRADARIENINLGAVQVILVDLEGTISAGMSGGAAASGRRMINAIVKHANGPHFVKAIGPSAAMAKSADAIKAFIKSAKPVG